MDLQPDKIARAMERDQICSVDLSAFSEEDILNVVLQRSEILFDVPQSGRVIRAWSNGDSSLLQGVVEEKGETILRRALASLYVEYEELKPVLERLRLKRVADIGCGYAFIDLFLTKDFDTSLVLIDLEQNDRRHFGFKGAGAAYSSLTVARQFLLDNGVDGARIQTLNPGKDDPLSIGEIDLAISLLSCGFHYPVSTYSALFRDRVSADGAIILDLRLSSKEAQLGELVDIGQVSTLSTGENRNRIIVSKPVFAAT